MRPSEHCAGLTQFGTGQPPVRRRGRPQSTEENGTAARARPARALPSDSQSRSASREATCWLQRAAARRGQTENKRCASAARPGVAAEARAPQPDGRDKGERRRQAAKGTVNGEAGSARWRTDREGVGAEPVMVALSVGGRRRAASGPVAASGGGSCLGPGDHLGHLGYLRVRWIIHG